MIERKVRGQRAKEYRKRRREGQGWEGQVSEIRIRPKIQMNKLICFELPLVKLVR